MKNIKEEFIKELEALIKDVKEENIIIKDYQIGIKNRMEDGFLNGEYYTMLSGDIFKSIGFDFCENNKKEKQLVHKVVNAKDSKIECPFCNNVWDMSESFKDEHFDGYFWNDINKNIINNSFIMWRDTSGGVWEEWSFGRTTEKCKKNRFTGEKD